MIAQLRGILLGFGLLLIGGLWWWGRRRSGAASDESIASMRGPERHEPHLAPEPEPHRPPPDADRLPTVEVPVYRSEERQVSGANPPVVTIDNLPENAEDVVLIDGPVHVSEPWVRTESLDVHEDTVEVPTLTPEEGFRERRRPRLPPPPLVEAPLPPPTVAVDPLIDTIVERKKRTTPAEPPARQQRIVSIRLIAHPETRIEGSTLRQALAAERLTFGRYSIFHRMLEDERPVYSVASLVEPGSFDPDLMVGMQFPGVSLFAVFPGPLPAPQAFDELLATARRLADKLGGVLQDDAGSSLTGQRVLSLREELVYFEHLVGLGRNGRTTP